MSVRGWGGRGRENTDDNRPGSEEGAVGGFRFWVWGPGREEGASDAFSKVVSIVPLKSKCTRTLTLGTFSVAGGGGHGGKNG